MLYEVITWKWILGIFICLILALMTAVYVLLRTYDYNKLKPRLTQMVRETTGRELNLGGEIDLAAGFSRITSYNVCYTKLLRIFLQDPQKLHLKGQRQFTDFIQKNRAAVRFLKQPVFIFICAGKCAFFITEQFAFQNMLRNSGAVYGDKGPFAAIRNNFV